MQEADQPQDKDVNNLNNEVREHLMRKQMINSEIKNEETLIARLRASEEHSATLTAIVDSTNDAIISKDLNGFVTSWNLAAERIFGYSAAEMIGVSITKLIPLDRSEEEADILTRIRIGERVEHFETMRLNKAGVLVDVSLTVSPIKDAFGKVIGVSKIARDISEAKKAHEKSLMLSAIVDSTDDAIISKNLNGIITSWNTSAQRIFGYLPEEIIGQSVLKLIPEDRQDEETLILSRIRQGERVRYFHTKRLTKNGRLIDVSLTISPVKNEQGMIIGVSKIAREITNLIEAEKQGAILSAIVSYSDDAIISKDLNSIVTSWNKSAERIFGYTAAEMIGQSIVKLIPEDRLQEEPEIIARIKSGHRVDHFETKRMTKYGAPLDVSLTISPVIDLSGRIIGISKIARDITDKKQEEQRKNDFIAIVSHELKTPLTSMRSYVQIALKKAIERADAFTEKVLVRAESKTHKMASLIQDFLDLSRLEEAKMTLHVSRFSMPELIEEVLSDTLVLSASHHIEYEPCPDIKVNADREKLGQVMINLLGNAIKYSPEGTIIKIRCELGKEKIKFSVTDQGNGIAKADQARLFERFYRVNDQSQYHVAGFGIGLYLVSEILKLHGGKAEVQSEVGEGSTFSFVLPASVFN
jgi:two-component system sensor histidine kinase VicK